MKTKLCLLAILSAAALAEAQTVHTVHIDMDVASSAAGYIKPTLNVGFWKNGHCATLVLGVDVQLWVPEHNETGVIDETIEIPAEYLSMLNVFSTPAGPVDCVSFALDYQGQHWADEFLLNWDASHTQVLSTTPSMTEMHQAG